MRPRPIYCELLHCPPPDSYGLVNCFLTVHKTLRRATSSSVAHVPEEIAPKVPTKLIDREVDKGLKLDKFGKLRKHPLRIVDLPSYTISMHLSEIPPGKRTGLHRHHNEAIVYILSGRGYTEIEGRSVKWRQGDAVYVPPWAWHAHHNLNKHRPARYLAATNSPLLQNVGGLDRRQERGLASLTSLRPRSRYSKRGRQKRH